MEMLQVGALYRHEGEVYRCVRVNACRARIVPVSKRRHVEVTRPDGDVVAFDAPGRAIDVSPFSLIERVQLPAEPPDTDVFDALPDGAGAIN